MGVGEIGLVPDSALSSLPRFEARASFRRTPLTGSLNERIRTVVNARAEDALNASRARFDRFARYDKIIQMVSRKKPFEWKANAYLPYALATAEMSAAIKAQKIMASSPIVNVEPGKGGAQEVADHREGLIQWHLENDINLPTLLPELLRSSERYGKFVAKVIPQWDRKITRFREKVNIPLTMGPIARMEWKTTNERAYSILAQPVDLVTCLPQPGKSRINGVGGMDWFITEYYLTYDDILELEADQMWGPMVGGESSAALYDTHDSPPNEWIERRMMLLKRDATTVGRDRFDRTVRVLEYQGLMPQECIDPMLAEVEMMAGLDPRNRVVLLANDRVVGANQALPWDHGFKSFVEGNCIPNNGDFWGMGKVEVIEHLIYVANEIMNMRIDNVKAAINGLIGVDTLRMPPGWKKRLVSQPWGVHETNGPPNEIIQRLQLGDVTQSSYQEQAQIYGLVQEASSINETMLGAPGSSERTLGEHQLKSAAGNRRLDFEVALQSAQLFSASKRAPGLVHFMLTLDRQYMPLGQIFSIMEPRVPDSMAMFTLEPADLSDDLERYRFQYPASVEAMQKAEKRLDMMNLMQTLAPWIPILQATGADLTDLVKQVIRAHDVDVSRMFRFAMPSGAMMPGMPGAPGMPGGQPGGPPGGPGQPHGIAGGSLRPEQRAAPGTLLRAPWAQDGSGDSGYKRVRNTSDNAA